MAWELGADGYVLVADVEGEDVFEAPWPFSVPIAPTALVGR